jgi:hypothetical protein
VRINKYEDNEFGTFIPEHVICVWTSFRPIITKSNTHQKSFDYGLTQAYSKIVELALWSIEN